MKPGGLFKFNSQWSLTLTTSGNLSTVKVDATLTCNRVNGHTPTISQFFAETGSYFILLYGENVLNPSPSSGVTTCIWASSFPRLVLFVTVSKHFIRRRCFAVLKCIHSILTFSAWVQVWLLFTPWCFFRPHAATAAAAAAPDEYSSSISLWFPIKINKQRYILWDCIYRVWIFYILAVCLVVSQGWIHKKTNRAENLLSKSILKPARACLKIKSTFQSQASFSSTSTVWSTSSKNRQEISIHSL